MRVFLCLPHASSIHHGPQAVRGIGLVFPPACCTLRAMSLLQTLVLFLHALTAEPKTEPVRACCSCAVTGEQTCWQIEDPPPALSGPEICALADGQYTICALTEFGLLCPDVCGIWAT